MKREHFVMLALFALAWVVLLGQPTGFSRSLRGFFLRLTTPFARLGDLIPVVHTNRRLETEIRDLRAANADLQRQLHEAQAERDQNQRLRELLAFKNAAPWRTVGARVIGRDASNWWKSIQLDRGSADGIRPNQPVVVMAGLLGKIVSVTAGESRALLLTDPNCRVSVALETSREPGIVGGFDTAFAHTARLQMTFVNRHAQVSDGERVITTGLGGVFPRGIVVGTVVQARLNEATGMFQDVEIQPAADFRHLEEVLVIVE